MALLPFLRAPSRSGTASTERGVDTAPFQIPDSAPTRAAAPVTAPTTLPGGSSKFGDQYPGDEAFNALLTELFDAIRSEGASIQFDEAFKVLVYDEKTRKNVWVPHAEPLSRKDLIKLLVGRLCETPVITSRTPIGATTSYTAAISTSGFEWVMGFAPTPAQIASLERCLEQAVLSPTGYASSAAGRGFARWSGTNYGHWFSPTAIYRDISLWYAPVKKEIDPTSKRYQWLQTVYWAATKDDWGWNLSDEDTLFVWGWDPKNQGDLKGRAGAHLGFPATFQGCDFILWLTKREAFLEAVNHSDRGGGATTRKLDVDGITREGAPKFSAYIGTGYGQWVLAP